ncbi:MAG: adenylate/guanylate cyclase domain-containing protein [Candidatus Pacearchaeota archaeon]|jgi:class 3 adenylate cyclase
MYDLLKKEERETIERINSKIHGPEYLSKKLKSILSELNFLLKIENAIIYIREGKSQKTEFLGNAKKYWEEYFDKIDSNVEKAITQNKPIITNDLNKEIKKLIVIPINSNNEIVGFLIIINKKVDYGSNKRNTEIIKIIESQIKLAIERTQEREEIFDLFGRYLDKRQIAQILENPDFLKKPKAIEAVVLFADLADFTKFANNKNVKDVFQFLSKMFYEYTKIINKNNGIVDKFVGDQIIGIFGITDPNNRSENAIKSAIEMEDILKKEFENNNIGVKIGIVKQEVLYGNLGGRYKSDLTVIGPGVNLAARICSFADKGEILVNKKIYDKLKKIHKFKIKGFKRFKGFDNKEPVYKLMLNQSETSLVKKRELGRLHSNFSKMFKHQKPTISEVKKIYRAFDSKKQ